MKIGAAEPYNLRVRDYFVNPVHAGSLKKSYSFSATAEVDDGAGTSLVLLAGIEGDTLAEIRYQAVACPHLIAAAEYFCRQYSGTPVASLLEFRPAETIQDLAVPAGKTGRILLLEDAIRLLWQHISDDKDI